MKSSGGPDPLLACVASGWRDYIEGDYTVARSAGFREYPLALRVALALNGTSGSDNAEEVPGSR
jgi:hypothetical protein